MSETARDIIAAHELEREEDNCVIRIGDDADEIIAKLEAAGFFIVPKEPTEAMRDALSATDKQWRDLNSTTVWQTYIDAARA